jgi:hypothetical protein
MTKTEQIYLAIMLIGGIVMGLATRIWPNWSAGVPPLLFLLGVSLLFDIVLNQWAAQGKATPLTTRGRAIGFVSGGLASLVIPYVGQA